MKSFRWHIFVNRDSTCVCTWKLQVSMQTPWELDNILHNQTTSIQQKKKYTFTVLAIKRVGEVELQHHVFLTSVLDASDWWATCPGILQLCWLHKQARWVWKHVRPFREEKNFITFQNIEPRSLIQHVAKSPYGYCASVFECVYVCVYMYIYDGQSKSFRNCGIAL